MADPIVLPGASERDSASMILPKPPQCKLWDDETWAVLHPEVRREVTKIYEKKIEFSDEYRSFLNEFVIGTDCPDAPSSASSVRILVPALSYNSVSMKNAHDMMVGLMHSQTPRKAFGVSVHGGCSAIP
jgi:hypothetical protein